MIKTNVVDNTKDPRAEREAFAACIKGLHGEVLAYCAPENFETPAYYRGMKVVRELALEGSEVTYATICAALQRKGWLDEQTESAFESAAEMSIHDAGAAAKIVKDKAVARSFLEKIESTATALRSGRMTSEEAVSVVVSDSLSVDTGVSTRSRHVSEVAASVRGRLASLRRGDALTLSTSITPLDIALGGFLPENGEILGLTGPAGSMKSLLKNIMCDMAVDRGIPTISYILEMTAEQELMRRVAIRAKGQISAKKFRGGPGTEMPTDEEFDLYEKHLTVFDDPDYPFWLESGKFGLSEILADAERRVYENGVKVIALDYVQLIQSGDGGDRTRELERISSAIRRFALKHKVGFIPVFRLNQAGAKEALKGGDLTGAEISGASQFIYDVTGMVTLAFDRALILCGCKVETQLIEDEKTGKISSMYKTAGRFCNSCGQKTAQSDLRLGDATVLKARDGDTFAKVPLLFEGKSLSITERTNQMEPTEVIDADGEYDALALAGTVDEFGFKN